MCGIAGFLSLNNSVSAQDGISIIKKMCSALSHRGPDASGSWSNPEHGVFLGHTRLSIQDLSKAGAQPMVSHSTRFVMSYNGEIYNKGEIEAALKAEIDGLSFKGRSDTEILLEAFAHWGVQETLSRIRGMFAIALWDEKEGALTLIRDHVGEKPLYVGVLDGKCVYASELKALKKSLESTLDIDRKSLNYYKYFGFIPSHKTIYKDVYKLKPGHVLNMRASDVEKAGSGYILDSMRQYWGVESAVQADIDAAQSLEDVLMRAVKGRMISDVPLGSFLSGGIDSSLVTALMQAQSNSPVKSYSIGFESAEFDESAHAEKIAQHLGTDHTTYMVGEGQMRDIIPKLPEIYDEPFADYSQIPTAILCQQARKDTVVALSGDGGDEVFCGYKRYFMLKRLLDKTGTIPYGLRKILAGTLSAPSQKTYGRVGLNGRRIHTISDFLKEPDFYSSIMRGLCIDGRAERPDSLELWDDEDLTDLERMMILDTQLYLPDDILVKVDRASMYSSLEVRCPLLDKDVIEYAWGMPLNEKVFKGQGRGKKPLYDILCKYVPQELVDRPKQGFTPPVASWLRGSLKDWAYDLLQQDSGLYTLEEMASMWDDFITERTDNHHALWAALMAQSWYISVYNQN